MGIFSSIESKAYSPKKKRGKEEKNQYINRTNEREGPALTRREFFKKAINATSFVLLCKLFEGIYSAVEEKAALKRREVSRIVRSEREVREMKKQSDQLKAEGPGAVCDDVLAMYHEVYDKTKYCPAYLRDPNLHIAQEMQESKFNNAAVSPKGAIGVMQNRPKSVEDVLIYSGRLFNNTDLNVRDYGKAEAALIAGIMAEIQKNPEYSRAFGRMYMLMLQDPDFGYKFGIGYGDEGKKLEEILAGYNAGPTRVTEAKAAGEKFPAEARGYVAGVKARMNLVQAIREDLEKFGYDGNKNNAVRFLAEKLPTRKQRLPFLEKVAQKDERLAKK